ncbi:type VII secretion protein EccE [Micromonospora sp. NPDC050397]|uniref:type VII secretion protein EccE n=1 Tax=Micromonospora sp. NPDC050397 TaxID=3364279 RepID=UPI003850B68E
MTQVQAPPAQAGVARTGSPTRLGGRRRRGRIGPLAVGQIVVVEVGLVAVGVTLGRPVWLVAIVATVAVLAVGAVFVRRRGRWWYEDLGLRRRLRQRARRAATAKPSADDPRLSALAPDLTLTDVLDRGSRFGVGQDDHGWFLACVVAPESSDPTEPVEASTVDRAVEVLAGYTGPGSSAQVVARTLVRAAEPGVPAELVRDVWVALRLSVPDARVEAVNRGGGIPGVHRTMAAAAGRLGKALTGAGLAYQVLDRDELRATILDATGLDLVDVPQVETWKGLTGGGLTQLCLSLRSRSDLSYGELVDAVTAVPVVSHTLSVTVGGGGPVGAPLLRVAAGDSEIARFAGTVGEVVGRHSVTSRPLDGRHGPAVYASAPVAAERPTTGVGPIRV